MTARETRIVPRGSGAGLLIVAAVLAVIVL